MSNWITGKDLAAYWDIEGFELFDCLKNGLQPYTTHGKRIVNIDILEHGRKHPLEHFMISIRRLENLARGAEETGTVITRNFSSSPRVTATPLTERQIVQQAQKDYEKQPLELINPPQHYMSFTLPDDGKEAMKAILKVMWLKFRKDEASEYAKKHGYRSFSAREETANLEATEHGSEAVAPVSEKEAHPVANEINVRDIFIELAPDDKVRIQIPGEPEKVEHLTNLGFGRVNTNPANALKTILECGEYLSSSDADRKSPEGANKKLQEYFESKEKFIVLGTPGSGRYVPLFKIRKQVQIEQLERLLESAWERGDKDSVHDTISKAFEDKRITAEEAKILSYKFPNVSAQSMFDEYDVAKNPSDKGPFHLIG